MRFQNLDLTSATLLFEVEVSNPCDVEVPLADLDYALASGERTFLTGKASVQSWVPARGTKTIPLTARVVFLNVLEILKEVKPGNVVPYTATFKLATEVPAVGPVELPVKKDGELPIPTAPSVELAGIQWESLSLNEAAAMLDVRLVNHNDFPVDLSKLSYALSLGDVPVVKGKLGNPQSFTPGVEGALPIRASFIPRNLGLAAFSMLTGKGARYKLTGTMELNTPFASLYLPYERSGETEFRRK